MILLTSLENPKIKQTMLRTYSPIILVILAGALFQSCGSRSSGASSSQEEHKHEEEHDHGDAHGHEAGIELTRAQLDLANIQLGQLEPLELSSSVKATGRIVLPSQHRASVNAVKGGQVADILVKPGEQVKQGQQLASLRDPYFIEVQQKYLGARAQLQYQRARFNRKQALYNGEVGAKEALQQARAAYRSQQSVTERYATELRMLNLNPKQMKDSGDIRETVPLQAPISGIVQQVKVRIGQYLEPRSTLFTILEREHLRLKIMVYEKHIGKVAVGQRVFANRVDEKGEPVSGRITGINHGMNENQQGVEVYAAFDTVPNSFKPGMYMEAQLITNTKSGTALPNSGMVRHQQSQYIFYTTHAKADTLHFRRQPVRAGPTEGQFTTINPMHDLPEEASVVTHNAHYLLREMMEGAGGGHSH